MSTPPDGLTPQDREHALAQGSRSVARVVDAPTQDAAASSQPMPFLAHLGELRRRIIICVVTLAVSWIVAFTFAEHLFAFARLPLAAIPNSKMIVLDPLEMFTTYMKLAMAAALMVSSPVILLQLWLFVAPGLYPSERKYVVPFVVSGSGFFVGGAAFCFYLVLPASFAYLVDMVPKEVEAQYSVALYFSLIVQLMLAFGLVFELPLIMTLLGASGLIPAEAFARFRRYWIVLATFLAGLLTPTGDLLTQAMMAAPLMIFFELGIVGARLVGRREKRRAGL